jgi:hypothetical protein
VGQSVRGLRNLVFSVLVGRSKSHGKLIISKP